MRKTYFEVRNTFRRARKKCCGAFCAARGKRWSSFFSPCFYSVFAAANLFFRPCLYCAHVPVSFGANNRRAPGRKQYHTFHVLWDIFLTVKINTMHKKMHCAYIYEWLFSGVVQRTFAKKNVSLCRPSGGPCGVRNTVIILLEPTNLSLYYLQVNLSPKGVSSCKGVKVRTGGLKCALTYSNYSRNTREIRRQPLQSCTHAFGVRKSMLPRVSVGTFLRILL